MRKKRKIYNSWISVLIKNINSILYMLRCTVNQIETELQCIFLMSNFVFF